MQQRGLELAHDLHRLDPRRVVPVAFGHARQHQQHGDVLADARLDARAHDLDHHVAAVGKLRGVDLGDGCRRQHLPLEHRESLGRRHAELRLDDALGFRPRKRRHPVEQLLQLVGDFVAEQVAAGGQHLAELDEDRAQRLDTQAQAHGLRLAAIAKPVERVDQPEPVKRAEKENRQHHLVEAEARRGKVDADQAEQVAHRDQSASMRSCSARSRASLRATSCFSRVTSAEKSSNSG